MSKNDKGLKDPPASKFSFRLIKVLQFVLFATLFIGSSTALGYAIELRCFPLGFGSLATFIVSLIIGAVDVN